MDFTVARLFQAIGELYMTNRLLREHLDALRAESRALREEAKVEEDEEIEESK